MSDLSDFRERYKRMISNVLKQSEEVAKEPLSDDMLKDRQDKLKTLLESKKLALDMMYNLITQLEEMEGGESTLTKKKDFKQGDAERYAE